MVATMDNQWAACLAVYLGSALGKHLEQISAVERVWTWVVGWVEYWEKVSAEKMVSHAVARMDLHWAMYLD